MTARYYSGFYHRILHIYIAGRERVSTRAKANMSRQHARYSEDDHVKEIFKLLRLADLLKQRVKGHIARHVDRAHVLFQQNIIIQHIVNTKAYKAFEEWNGVYERWKVTFCRNRVMLNTWLHFIEALSVELESTAAALKTLPPQPRDTEEEIDKARCFCQNVHKDITDCLPMLMECY